MTALPHKFAPPCATVNQDSADHLAVHAGQPPFEPIAALDEPLVVNSEKVQHCRVHVVAVDGV